MTSRKNKNLISDNAGLSLIELVVGLLILTIIMAPTLGMFVAALKSTSQANRDMHAQNLASNVMEEVKFYGVEKLTTSAPAGYVLDGAASDSATGNYVLSYATTGDYVVEGDEKFMVDITISATEDTGVAAINNAEFGDYSNVAADDTLIINPNKDASDLSQTADYLAFSEFLGSISYPSGIGINELNIRDKLNRKLYIDIKYDNAASQYVVNYYYVYTPIYSGNFTTPQYAVGVTDNSIVKDELGTLYFLYTPYKTSTYGSGINEKVILGTSSEVVDITGTDLQMTDDILIYLVVQTDKTLDKDNSYITIVPNGDQTKFGVASEAQLYGVPSRGNGVVKEGSKIKKTRLYTATVDIYRVVGGVRSDKVTSVSTTISK